NAFTATTRSTDSFTWTSSTPSVATVGGDGEVTILTAGNTTITATRAQSDSIEAATLSYSLMVATFPPILPVGPITADAVEGAAISDLVLENAAGGADITNCSFISGDRSETSLSGLLISTDTDKRSCTIRGTVAGDTGVRNFTVRALSLSDQDEVVVTFMLTSVPPNGARQLATGLNNNCIISTVGQLFCWGSRADGRTFNSPNRVSTATNWSQVSAGGAYNCAIDSDRSRIFCWGSLGFQPSTDQASPNRLGVESGFVQVSTGARHSCIIDIGIDINPGGFLACWGIGAGHRLGRGSSLSNSLGPGRVSRVGSDATWLQVSAGGAHSCATNVAGELHCWGSGSSGQTGQGGTPTSTSVSTTPARVGMATNWTQVSAGAAHTCALNTDDELYCWGESDSGRLGLGAVSADGASPAEVAAPTNTSWSQASAGSEHTCAITMTGALYCWGEGDSGRLGLGTDTADKTTPTQVGSDTDWVMVGTGEAHTCAIKTVDQLYCWGKADSGQLGLGDTDG
ncbi:MAG: Ig-like domain-containing protein, partial [Proteobacteria bacterium]|nr:Ig-like domain-containing protein [Pseudomonadota bacterium]